MSRAQIALAALLFAGPLLAAEPAPAAPADPLSRAADREAAGWAAAAVSQDPPPIQNAEGSPIVFTAAYTGEAWRGARGARQGSRYLDNLDLALTLDAERALGWTGATILVSGLYNNGRSLSGDLIGDAQGISNIETDERAVRLFEAWVEQRLLSDRVSLKAGLYDLNSEFDTTETGGLFINPSHGIGPDFSQSGRNGPSIFPVTSLAFRIESQVSDRWLLRAVVLDAVPGDPRRPGRTAVSLSKDEGALVAAELNHVTENMKIALGHWRYTGRFEPVSSDQVIEGPPARTGNKGVYVLAERRLTREAGEDQGLSGFLRFGIADEAFNPIGRYLGGGLVYSGPLSGRDQDRIGLAVGVVEFGSPYRAAQESVGASVGPREVNLELTYRAPINAWLTLQPDVQFVLDPSGDPDLPNAVTLGLRFEVSR